jgi:formylglycine-generating enzyme required for sulfatase activity
MTGLLRQKASERFQAATAVLTALNRPYSGAASLSLGGANIPTLTPPSKKQTLSSRRKILTLLGLGGVGVLGGGVYALVKGGQATSSEVISVDRRGKRISHRPLGPIETLREDLGQGATLEMLLMPVGRFVMGTDENGRYQRERPQHEVTMAAFMIGKYAVTQAQWKAVMGTDPSFFKGGDRPVEQVNWGDAIAFCQALSKRTGRTYRLPSEAEWEYVCRAGTSTPFSFGPTITSALANYDGTKRYGEGPQGDFRQQTTAVGLFPPNAYGLYDMHGNVWEWCQDTFHENYQGAPSDGSAWETDGQTERVVRGGSWFNPPWMCHSAYRDPYAPEVRNRAVGFRVVTSV